MNPLVLAAGICYLLAFLLVAEFVVFSLPGAQWNGAKRLLFKLAYPFLNWSLGPQKLRGLVLAVILAGLGYGLGPLWAHVHPVG